MGISDELNSLRIQRDAAIKACRVARAALHVWHGDPGWPQYQESLEMKTINAAIAIADGGLDARVIAELLSACKQALFALGPYEDVDLPNGYCVKGIITNMRAAITATEGSNHE